MKNEVKNLPITKDNFIFSNSKHSYTYRGKEVLSTTTIINGRKSSFGGNFRMDFGTNVHEHIADLQAGKAERRNIPEEMILNQVDEAKKGGFTALRELILEGMGLAFTVNRLLDQLAKLPIDFGNIKHSRFEFFVVGEYLGERYAGRVDFILYLNNGDKIVIDWKTGKLSSAKPEQVAAYAKILGATRGFLVGETEWQEVDIEAGFNSFSWLYRSYFNIGMELTEETTKTIESLSKDMKKHQLDYNKYNEAKNELTTIIKASKVGKLSNEYVSISKSASNRVGIKINY